MKWTADQVQDRHFPAFTCTPSPGQEDSAPSVNKLTYSFQVGAPCYALYYGPRRDKDPRWIVTKVFGSCSVNMSKGHHIEQLQLGYGAQEDVDPDETSTVSQHHPYLLPMFPWRNQLKRCHKTNQLQKPNPGKHITTPTALLVMSMVLVTPEDRNDLRENTPTKIALQVR